MTRIKRHNGQHPCVIRGTVQAGASVLCDCQEAIHAIIADRLAALRHGFRVIQMPHDNYSLVKYQIPDVPTSGNCSTVVFSAMLDVTLI